MGQHVVRRFELEVTVTGTVAVEAEHARAARDVLLVALDRTDAVVATGPGAGLVVAGLRPSPDVALLRIDGVDPTAALAEALRAHREGGG